MDHIGIDVHKRDSQIYILAQGGEVVEQRIRTEAERFAAVLASSSRTRTRRSSTSPSRIPACRAARPC
jgi:hypothetical protein